MTMSPNNQPTVVAYTAYPWSHALAILRIVRPVEQGNMRLIQGNHGDDIDPERVSLGDLVLIQREFPNYFEKYEQIVALARQQGKPIIYEIDDLLLDLPDDHPDQDTHYYTSALLPMLKAILEADLVTTSTVSLGKYLSRLNPNIRVLPNCLDDQIWNIRPVQPKLSQGQIVIGYMGSTTHRPDLETLGPMLQTLIEQYGDRILLKFWGARPPVQIETFSNVAWQPLETRDYAQFADYFAHQEADIWIAPLNNTFFNQCKSPIKFFEYSALGVPGVYSRVEPYEHVIHDGRTGFLASSQEEWITRLQELIENPRLRYEIGHQAQQNVYDNWLYSQHGMEWRSAYEAVLQRSTSEISQKVDQAMPIYSQIIYQLRSWQNEWQNTILGKEQEIHSLEAQLKERQQYVDEIHSSTGWKLVQFLWKIRLALFSTKAGSKKEPPKST